PAARRPGGLRPPAGSRRDHQGSAGHVAQGGDRGGHAAGGGGGRLRRRLGPEGGRAVTAEPQQRWKRGRRSGRGKGRGEQPMVPRAEFTSYYGRPIVKAAPWQADIPTYLFLGGLAGGSSLLAAGADLTGRPRQRRVARVTASAALSGSLYALIHDLG